MVLSKVDTRQRMILKKKVLVRGIMKRIEIKENNLNMVYEITDENEIKLLHFSTLPFDENDINSCEGTASFRPVEVLLSGLNRPGERHGTKYTYTAPGYRLKYKDMKDYRNETGRKIEILMEDKPTGLEVCSNIQFYDGISVIRFGIRVCIFFCIAGD